MRRPPDGSHEFRIIEVRPFGGEFALAAHAKLNLALSVHGRLPDGRHTVSTVLQAISLHDLLFARRAERTALEVEGDAPPGTDNLVLRAQAALEQAAGQPLPVAFRLLKRIPAGAGLAGGSSDAAAALRAVAKLYGVKLDLHPLAAELGADVPFFIRGGSAEASGIGADLRPTAPATGWFAIAWPGFGVDTGRVYDAWDSTGGAGPNQLQSAAFAVEPRLQEFAAGLGTAWQMTGSGSAFFKAVTTREEAEEAVGGLECWTAVAHPVGAWD
jgi:4-diphosphocytidyl-2-C-methyl-D-erythritol kinase